jgi:hypothetical protein
MKTILTAFFNWAGALNPFLVAIFLVVTTLATAFQWLNSQWGVMIAKIDAMSVSAFGGSLDVSPLGLLNTFIPLVETLSLFSAWVAVLLLAASVRIVKSFVPTVAS